MQLGINQHTHFKTEKVQWAAKISGLASLLLPNDIPPLFTVRVFFYMENTLINSFSVITLVK